MRALLSLFACAWQLAAAAAPIWPAPGAPLVELPVEIPANFGVRRVVVDPGHGNPGNPGNTSAYCLQEQEHTLALSLELAAALEATGAFEVRLARLPGEQTDYVKRIEDARAWGAEVLVSLHSDTRGEGQRWSPPLDPPCQERLYQNPLDPGFSVLWSDEGPAPLAAGRLKLARSVAVHLRRAGFPPYGGANYEGLYAGDAAVPGVFVDRHQPRYRIRMLRRPSMPSIIIETHHAWDPQEALRWEEAPTRAAFTAAVAAALVDVLAAPPPPTRLAAPGPRP